MNKPFKDYFSSSSSEYRLFRPRYPAGLFAYLASIAPDTHLAWDCATGSGQTAVDLCQYFSRVVATDASAEQIENVLACDTVSYEVAPAEQSGLDAASTDLITVAQALHWFDIPAFIAEVRRVLKPGGVLAVWTYNLLRIDPDIDALIEHLYGSVLEDYWPEERALVENGYQDIHLPLEELEAPVYTMSTEWTLSQLRGYLRTWSALKRYQAHQGTDPLEFILARLEDAWGDKQDLRSIDWPLSLRVWKQ